MTERLDPRIHAYRPDLAAAGLEGRVEAARFAEGTARQVVAPFADMAEAPGEASRLGSQALFGETVTVYDERDGWAWGQLDTDGYVGYFPSATLGDVGPAATHRVAVPRTCLYPEATIKSRPVRLISLGALLAVERIEGDFARLAEGRGFVFARHVAPVGVTAPDPLLVAEAFLATPYVWGGRQSLGLDCSGLVQLSLAAAGIACPRDSDLQMAALGHSVDSADLAALRRGDLVFWKGHVAMMVDDARMIHASGHHMLVVVEPLAGAVMRYAGAGLEIAGIRRLETPAG